MPILEIGQEVSFGDYLISLEANNHAIIRHKVTDEDVQPSFYEMQTMKCIAFGGDAAAIEIFPKQRDLFDGRNQLLDALKNMLMSQDCEWENKDQGHDWAEACEYARKVIEDMGKE